MKLTTAHKITIGTSVVFSALFSGWTFARYAQTGEPGILVVGSLSAVACAILFGYLIRFSRANRATIETTQETIDAPPPSA